MPVERRRCVEVGCCRSAAQASLQSPVLVERHWRVQIGCCRSSALVGWRSLVSFERRRCVKFGCCRSAAPQKWQKTLPIKVQRCFSKFLLQTTVLGLLLYANHRACKPLQLRDRLLPAPRGEGRIYKTTCCTSLAPTGSANTGRVCVGCFRGALPCLRVEAEFDRLQAATNLRAPCGEDKYLQNSASRTAHGRQCAARARATKRSVKKRRRVVWP